MDFWKKGRNYFALKYECFLSSTHFSTVKKALHGPASISIPTAARRDTQEVHLVIVIVTETYCYLDYCCGLNPSKNRSVAPWKKKKNFAQTAATGGAEKKRVDMHHNTPSTRRKQHEGHDQLVYGHTWGGNYEFCGIPHKDTQGLHKEKILKRKLGSPNYRSFMQIANNCWVSTILAANVKALF